MDKGAWIAVLAAVVLSSCSRRLPPNPPDAVGAAQDDGVIVPTRQLIRPAGQTVELSGRPVDLVLSPDGKTAYVKNDRSVLVIDAESWSIRQQLPYAEKEGGSMHGIAIARDGSSLFVTTTLNRLREAVVRKDGKLAWRTTVSFPGLQPKKAAYPCGVALSDDGQTAWVCLSMNNALAVVDLENLQMHAQIPVGVAPYGVAVSRDRSLAYVTNWGGRRAKRGDKTAKSAGTNTVVNERGVASSGTVSIVDLNARKELAQIDVGLHPADLKLSADGSRLYVANANSDTVSVIDTAARKVTETILVRPDETLPFGSASNALALSADGKTLFVANGGNNAVAVVHLDNAGASRVTGFVPAGWYPGALATDGTNVYVANVKGIGSRRPKPNQKGWAVQQYQGTVTKVSIPSADQLQSYTRRVREDARVPQALAAWERAQTDAPPLPVPMRVGEPSVFEHVVYVIKENRTYDQVLGDIGRGNSDPRLCVFGSDVTPNHHALAQEFVLLDNYYCNGVVSADGHAWATEGLAVDYLEKAFGGFARSYPFGGDDPLAFASTGFIWDNVLLHGRSFRNYGEMALSSLEPKTAKFLDVYDDWKRGTTRVKIKQNIAIEALRRYSCPDYPGWNLKVPDALRLRVFMREFDEAQRTGEWPSFVTVYLPSDHTSGTGENAPTPASQVADNDLAVGKLIEAISHSRFWATTCIFVIEDDPQAGFDHVDGHRSFCLVASPYTLRGQVVSAFYNQTSVLHTMELMLGLPPMNQMDALAPVMRECFMEKPDLTPYTARPNWVPLDRMNPKKAKMAGLELELATKSEAMDLTQPDRADDDTLNRILWHSVKGARSPYPADFAGAHGRGLNGLRLTPTHGDGDDDDDD
ncbi:MAG TPA: alkaline phosphatase family protein [Tepidisphaeraceae bacterium]